MTFIQQERIERAAAKARVAKEKVKRVDDLLHRAHELRKRAHDEGWQAERSFYETCGDLLKEPEPFTLGCGVLTFSLGPGGFTFKL